MQRLFPIVFICLILSLALTAVGYGAAGRADVNKETSIIKLSDFSNLTTYCGFVGMVPATTSDFFNGGHTSVRVFYKTGAGKILVSRPMGSLGVLREIPGGDRLLYFGLTGLGILQPKSPSSRHLVNSWLVPPVHGRVIMIDTHYCALGIDGKWAAFAAWTPKTGLHTIDLVRVSDGRIFAMHMHKMITGLAFAGANLLVSTGVESSRLWTIGPSHAPGAGSLLVIRKATVPGKLVGMLGKMPVFEGRMNNVLFVGKKRITFQGVKTFDATCGAAEILITAKSGRILLWYANHVKFVVKLGNANMPYYDGCGTYRKGFWLSFQNGRVLLVTDRGKMQWITPKYPGPRKGGIHQ